MPRPKYKRKPKQYVGPPPAAKSVPQPVARPAPSYGVTSVRPPAEKSAPSPVAKPVVLPVATWGQSAAQRLLLTKFLTLRAADDFTRDDLWQSVLNQSPEQAIKQFLDTGAIRATTIDELLDYKFKAGELRRQLQSRQLSESGTKTQLIERIMSADPAWVQQATAGLAVYTCTDGGRALAESYLEQEKQQRTSAQQKALEALGQREYADAARIVYAFEAEQVFPRGMGVDWSHHETTQDEIALQAIFSCSLKALQALSAEQLEQVRLNAGIRWLFSYSYDDYPLPNELSDELLDDGFRLTSSLISNAHYHTVIKACRKSQALMPQVRHEVVYATCNDHLVCDECRKLAERTWTPDEAPELPYEKCTSDSESGCRCDVTWRIEAQ
jgi:hypothetical protein